MSLPSLTKPWQPISYGFLDASAKREIRRKMLKAVAVPGCQMPYTSHEVPMARGWGTGGMQVSLTLINPTTCVKVIDQGADDSVNAASIRHFFFGRCVRRAGHAAGRFDASRKKSWPPIRPLRCRRQTPEPLRAM
ncbi:alpha-D-ribose 1-methylphosphonate 5-phosphate C-P-lyase PhnJ [Sulfitobacter pontiacus]|uniref:alpha-D-ribose 1-methylphosphonate 5-phosphate C-P-lyase PhnJ n=1 Tax=Sulfitobacter pontiacus TaxID=60137 RepID=UPI0032982B17